MDPSTYLSRVLSLSSYSGRSLRSLGDASWNKLGIRVIWTPIFGNKYSDLFTIETYSGVLLRR